MATALVTGGSSGIGCAFATELASQGYDLVLVARGAKRLGSAAQALRDKYGVQVDELGADLSNTDDVQRVAQIFSTKRIDLLINGAGFAAHDDLLAEDWSGQQRAFDVMGLGVLVLSGAAAREMVKRGHGGIINIASVNALIPADNYSALKAWTINYTEGLAARLAGTGVHVNVTIAAWVKTDFHAAAGLARPHIPKWAWVPVDSLVKLALADLKRGKIRSVPTLRWRIAVWVLQHGPLSWQRKISHWVRSEHDKNRLSDHAPAELDQDESQPEAKDL